MSVFQDQLSPAECCSAQHAAGARYSHRYRRIVLRETRTDPAAFRVTQCLDAPRSEDRWQAERRVVPWGHATSWARYAPRLGRRMLGALAPDRDRRLPASGGVMRQRTAKISSALATAATAMSVLSIALSGNAASAGATTPAAILAPASPTILILNAPGTVTSVDRGHREFGFRWSTYSYSVRYNKRTRWYRCSVKRLRHGERVLVSGVLTGTSIIAERVAR
jgi:hypothetical protein